MNILITGITGLVGSELARAFSTLGTIHGLKRKGSDLSALGLQNLPIHWHEGDILDFNSLFEAMEGMDLVIHSAGKVSFLPQDEKSLFEVNHLGTNQVVNAMISAGVPKLVYVSSVAVLGQIPEQEEYDENSTWVDGLDQTAYARAKYQAELEVWRGEQEGLKVLVINPAVVLGKLAYARSSGALFQMVLNGMPFFPVGNLNYIDVRDAAAITLLLVEKGAWGERFILSKEGIPYAEFLHRAAQEFGGAVPKRALPNWFISWGFPILNFLGRLVGKKLPLTSSVARNAQRKTRYSNKKVEHYLQFRYRELQDTLNWANTGS